MCQNASWIEKDGQSLFLTDNDLNSKRGQELKKYLGSQYDVDKIGHGAIRWFFGIKDGVGDDLESTDFRDPLNFPVELVEAIKKGQRKSFFSEDMLVILKQPALAEYDKIVQSAWAEYEKIQQSAWAEYDKIVRPALAEYKKIKQSASRHLFSDPNNRIEVWR